MSKVVKLPRQVIRQCSHRHVSGNRCESRSDNLGERWKGPWKCDAHNKLAGLCAECRSMLRAFQPPGGW